MKAVSQFIAAVLLIVLVATIGSFLILWANELMSKQAGSIGGETEKTLECRKAGIRILDDTVKCNFTETDYLNFSLQNAGYADLYDLTAVVYFEGRAYTYDIVDIASENTFTKAYPLKIGEIKSVLVNITDDLPNGEIDWIRVTTQCPDVTDRIENITC